MNLCWGYQRYCWGYEAILLGLPKHCWGYQDIAGVTKYIAGVTNVNAGVSRKFEGKSSDKNWVKLKFFSLKIFEKK